MDIRKLFGMFPAAFVVILHRFSSEKTRQVPHPVGI